MVGCLLFAGSSVNPKPYHIISDISFAHTQSEITKKERKKEVCILKKGRKPNQEKVGMTVRLFAQYKYR